MATNGRNQLWWVVLALGLALRIGSAIAFPPPEGSEHLPDSEEYDRLARNLANWGRFTLEDHPDGRSDLTRTPVYPAFVAACYLLTKANPWAVVLVQVLISAATCGLVYKIGAWATKPSLGLLAAALAAVDPLSIRYSGLLLSETVFTFLICAGMTCSMAFRRRFENRYALGIGLAFGLAILCRPIAAFWPLAVAAWMVGLTWRRGIWLSLRYAAVVIAVASLLPAAWIVRNNAVAQLPVLTTIPGINLYYHRAAAVVADRDGISLSNARRQLADRLADTVQRDGLSRSEEYRLMITWGWEIIRGQPDSYLRATWSGMLRMMGPHEVDRDTWFVDAETVYLLLLYLLAFGGAARGLAGPDRAAHALLLLCVLYFVTVSGSEAYPRFRVPIMPAIALLASAFLFPPHRRVLAESPRQLPAC